MVMKWDDGREDREEAVADQKGGHCGDVGDAISEKRKEDEAIIQLDKTGCK